jgi:hypothetical protein
LNAISLSLPQQIIMAPTHPTRHVRRQTLAQRLEFFYPANLSLWLSEELNSQDWDDFSDKWSNTIGLALNLVFIFARINSAGPANASDIFEDYDTSAGGWVSWMASCYNCPRTFAHQF